MNENHYIFDQAIRTADMLVKMFGERCEVAVHDFSNLEKSLIYLSGSVTGREIGAPITDLVLKRLQNVDGDIKDVPNYKTISKNGHVMKSSTVFLKDSSYKVIGALCINIDISLLVQIGGEIEEFINFDDDKTKNENFYTNVKEVTEGMVNEVIHQFHRPPTLLEMEEKIECVRQLEDKGAFMIKGATDYLAAVLGVSKFTIYNYLQKIRSNEFIHTKEG